MLLSTLSSIRSGWEWSFRTSLRAASGHRSTTCPWTCPESRSPKPEEEEDQAELEAALADDEEDDYRVPEAADVNSVRSLQEAWAVLGAAAADQRAIRVEPTGVSISSR